MGRLLVFLLNYRLSIEYLRALKIFYHILYHRVCPLLFSYQSKSDRGWIPDRV